MSKHDNKRGFKLNQFQECDHDWEIIDDSFGPEYGVEQIVFERCRICDDERITFGENLCSQLTISSKPQAMSKKRASNIWFQGVAIAFAAMPILLFGPSVSVFVSMIAGACSFCFWIGRGS